jgi:signal transduction histidine kinase
MQSGAEKISFAGQVVPAGADARAKRSGTVARPLESSVLVVEDDARTLQVFAEILASQGLDFVTEASARAVLKRVGETDYAVIFLSERMPDLDGLATARLIRQCERSRTTPIILLTGTYEDTASGFRGREAGVSDYLLKPLVPEILRAKISVFVDLYGNKAALGREISARKAIEKELRNSEQKFRALAAHIQSVREDDRTGIAREIHDELGQALTGLKMDLSWLEKRLPGDLMEPAAKIKSMFRLIDDTIHSVRRIASDLRPQVLDDVGLTGAIKWQAREFQARTGIRCKVDLPEEPLVMDQERSTAVFRIFQEAMTNVARHARATRVEIQLRLDAGHLLLSVLDNGLGISPTALRSPKALGLLGVRERALLLGGKVGIEGVDGRGTSIRLSLPLQPQAMTSAKI